MRTKRRQLTYVLITPARNEERHIEKTLNSVVRQTRLPEKWVLVSDGSTDRTDEIISKYVHDYAWIDFIRLPERRDRQFAAKVQAFNAGYAKVKDLNSDIVGSLDADISFGPDYFEFLLTKLYDNPRLGVTGTPFVENGSHYDYRFTNIEHVSGACQLFRRECFEEIGGYIPIKGGGIDWTAVTTARMMGWQTRTFTEHYSIHHRPMGTGTGSQIQAFYRHGQKDYFLGSHALWQVFRSIYQMTRRPYVIGGLCLMFGYCWALLKKIQRPVSHDLISFVRTEQMNRLRELLYIWARRSLDIARTDRAP